MDLSKTLGAFMMATASNQETALAAKLMPIGVSISNEIVDYDVMAQAAASRKKMHF